MNLWMKTEKKSREEKKTCTTVFDKQNEFIGTFIFYYMYISALALHT